MAATGLALAEKWTFTPSVGATETYNWYSGENQPNGFVTDLTAALAIKADGARLKFGGTLGASEVLYSGQTQNNSFAPSANLAGHLEAIEKFFFVDATANVSQTYISPFGPQPSTLTTPTANRYTSETYSISPYVQGVFAPNIPYSLRDDNIWTPSTSYGNSSVKVPTTYYNNLNGQVASSSGPRGLTLQYTRNYYDNGLAGGTYTLQLGRAIASYQVDPQLQLSLRGGYESESFPLSSSKGAIYGGGIHWAPTDRTSVNGYWEHQFFGSSYSAQLSHRLPNVAISANFSRGLSTYPQLALLIPAGVPVAQFLDAAFTTRFPDPAERAQAVLQFLAQTGLPPTLASPLNFYAAQFTLQQIESLTLAWIGVRNALAFTVFNVKSEAIAGTGSVLPPALQFAANNTQTGAGVNFSHRLTGPTNLIATVSYTRTTPNDTEGTLNSARSDNFNAVLAVSTQFTPKTSGSVGVSYFDFRTPGANNLGTSSTVSVYASINHNF